MLRRIAMVGGMLLTIVLSVHPATAVDCTVGTTTTISPYLSSYMKSPGNAVAYAWTGGHYLGGNTWGHRTNPGDTIVSNTAGGLAISGPFTTNYNTAHPIGFDSSTAEARAQCVGPSCSTPTLMTNACVTAKYDSAGAGAYARAGVVAQPRTAGDTGGVATISIPNRMTLSSSVGDVTGIWALVVSIENGVKPDVTQEPLADIDPWMAKELGLQGPGFNLHRADNRVCMFRVGFQLDPTGTKITVLGPEFGTAWTDLKYQKSVRETFSLLAKKFRIDKCTNQRDDRCHIASYKLTKPEAIEVPIEWGKSGSNMFFIEVGQAAREEILQHVKPSANEPGSY